MVPGQVVFPSTLFLSLIRSSFTFYMVWQVTSPLLLSTQNILSFLPLVCLFLCCLPLPISSILFGVILQVSPFIPICKTCLNKTCFGLFRENESRVLKSAHRHPTDTTADVPLLQRTPRYCSNRSTTRALVSFSNHNIWAFVLFWGGQT